MSISNKLGSYGQCECGSITTDINKEGLLVCSGCGLVIDESPIQKYYPPRKQEYDRHGTESHAILNSNQIGNIKERVVNKASRQLIRLNRLNTILESERLVKVSIFLETRRILNVLGLSEKLQNGIVETTFNFYNQLEKRTKFRGPEKLVPIAIYLVCLQQRIMIRIPELVQVSSITMSGFKKGLKLLLTVNRPLYEEFRSTEFRKEHILLILSGLDSLFSLPQDFMAYAKDILDLLWLFINQTTDSAIAGLIYYLSKVYIEGLMTQKEKMEEWRGLYIYN